MKKVLFIKLKNICYGSTFLLTELLAREFRHRGIAVDVFDSSKRPLTHLDHYSGQTYDAIIDFNSKLPCADTEEGGWFLDTIHAPYYHYILDHPLYLHDSLKIPLDDYHVICLDRNHKMYLKDWYPHLQSVHFLPLPGLSSHDSYEKNIPLVFTGTYTSPAKVRALMDGFPAPVQEDFNALIEEMQKHPSLTLEQALSARLQALALSPENINFPEQMKAYFLVDTYITACTRERMVHAFMKSPLPLTIYGENWHLAEGARNTTLCPSVPFSQTPAIFAQSKIALNVMPWFKDGCHDRVFSAMAAHALSLTDTSVYLEEIATHKKELCFYSIEDPEDAVEKAAWLLSHPDQLDEIAAGGFSLYSSKHTVPQWADALLSLISN